MKVILQITDNKKDQILTLLHDLPDVAVLQIVEEDDEIDDSIDQLKLVKEGKIQARG